jgi:membrane-associated phospholipid phosphatase
MERLRHAARWPARDLAEPDAAGPPQRPASRPLLSDRATWACLVVLAACLLVLAALGAWVAHRTQATWIDGKVDNWLIGHRSSIPLVVHTLKLGEPTGAGAVCVVAGVACLVTRRIRGLLLVVIAVPLAGGLTEYLLKPLFDRTLTGFLSFPSGHVAAASAVATTAAILLTGRSGPPLYPAVRWLVRLVAVAIVLSVAAAVVIVHYHYFTDTIGGACVGTGTVLAAALLLDRIHPRQTGRPRSRRSPRSASGDTKRTASRPVDRAASTLPGESSMKTVRAGSRPCRSSRISKIAGSGFATPSMPETTAPSNHCRNSNRSRRTTYLSGSMLLSA